MVGDLAQHVLAYDRYPTGDDLQGWRVFLAMLDATPYAQQALVSAHAEWDATRHLPVVNMTVSPWPRPSLPVGVLHRFGVEKPAAMTPSPHQKALYYAHQLLSSKALTEAERVLFEAEGEKRGFSCRARDEDKTDATLVLGLSFALRYQGPIFFFVAPLMRDWTLERSRALLASAEALGWEGEKRDAQFRFIEGGFDRFKGIPRPWQVPNEPSLWIASGFDKTDLFLPPWLGPRLA
jgi:hypothetical protein